MYICKRCNYNSKYKRALLQHLNSKKPCEIINESIDRENLIEELTIKNYKEITFDCEYCQKKFNNGSNMYRHKKICKEKPTNKELQSNEINELKKEIGNLKNLIINNINNTNNTNNTNNQQINNINVSIPQGVKLKNFGRENMDALPESLIGSLFLDLRFRELLAQLHCDPNFPENQNVRIKSVKRNTMEIYRNNKWDIMTFSKGLTELLLHGHKIFKDYYNKDKERILEEDMTEDEIKEILNQLDKIEKLNKEELRPLLIELQMMLEEYRENGHAIVLS
jgi:uncharacterized CHY-type Zn-finger protein